MKFQTLKYIQILNIFNGFSKINENVSKYMIGKISLWKRFKTVNKVEVIF